MNYKTILLSPHSDDIALSIGGALSLNFFEKPIKIVTIFTKSKYAPCSEINDPELISETRQLEDSTFANAIGVDIQHLQFQEPEFRGYKSPLLKGGNAFSDPIFDKVYGAVCDIIKLDKNALVLSPMGIGHHIDHLIVSEISSKIHNENNINVAYYEDLPYAAYFTLKEIDARAKSLNSGVRPYRIDITTTINDKISNIELYKSQVCRKTLPLRVKLHGVRIGTKNKWLMEIVWMFNPFKYIFKKYCGIFKSLSSYERVWIVID